jgi:ribose transport system substrate-binding protein
MRKFTAVLTALAVAAITAACGSSSSGGNSSASSAGADTSRAAASLPGKGVKFGLSLPGLSSPGAIPILDGMQCYAKRVGGTVVAEDPGQSINTQISQVTDMLTAGAKAIMVTPFSSSETSALIALAKSHGAFIIESSNPKSVAPGSVYNDVSAPGRLAAEYFRAHIKGPIRAVVIGGPPIPLAVGFEDGFTDAAKRLGIQVLTVAHAQEFSTATGRTIADDLLTRYPQVNAMFVIESSMGVGAGLAVQARGAHVEVIDQGGDAPSVNAVKEGLLTAEADDHLADFGFQSAKVGALLTEHKRVAPVLIPTSLIDKSNLKTWRNPAAQCPSLH